jgi:UDP-glucose:(glucosyl)LPS alpha-1,2-glucosyltransferase
MPGPVRRVTDRVATVLPPKEGFSPGAVGAIGLLVHRMALAVGGDVVGRPVANPFPDVPFHPARPGLGLSATSRYAAGVARVLHTLSPDLVEVHNRPEIALHLARRFPRVVLFLHNDPQGMRGARSAAERRAVMARMQRVVAVSGYLRDRWLDGCSGRVDVLPNSIDIPPRVRRLRQRLILFVGRTVADKGADIFVEACGAVLPSLPGWRAEMIGADRFAPDSPDTGFVERLRTKAAQAGVTMLGYRPHAETMERLSRALIAVVPSRWPEPFGMTALEAMAYGVALVCSRRGGLEEVAGDAALYAEPDAPGAVAGAIMTLATDPSRRHALATAGRERAQGFGITQGEAALRRLRQDVLAGRTVR